MFNNGRWTGNFTNASGGLRVLWQTQHVNNDCCVMGWITNSTVMSFGTSLGFFTSSATLSSFLTILSIFVGIADELNSKVPLGDFLMTLSSKCFIQTNCDGAGRQSGGFPKHFCAICIQLFWNGKTRADGPQQHWQNTQYRSFDLTASFTSILVDTPLLILV